MPKSCSYFCLCVWSSCWSLLISEMSADISMTARISPFSSRIGAEYTIRESLSPLLVITSSSFEWICPSWKVLATEQFSQGLVRSL